jgi:hypothetical protein
MRERWGQALDLPMDVHTHQALLDAAEALAGLPDLSPDGTEEPVPTGLGEAQQG